MHWGRQLSPGNSQTQICLSDCQMVKRDLSLQKKCFQSPMAVSFTPIQQTLGIVHVDLWLVCGCSAMETRLHEAPNEQFLC
jgi:hypothetical protein